MMRVCLRRVCVLPQPWLFGPECGSNSEWRCGSAGNGIAWGEDAGGGREGDGGVGRGECEGARCGAGRGQQWVAREPHTLHFPPPWPLVPRGGSEPEAGDLGFRSGNTTTLVGQVPFGHGARVWRLCLCPRARLESVGPRQTNGRVGIQRQQRPFAAGSLSIILVHAPGAECAAGKGRSQTHSPWSCTCARPRGMGWAVLVCLEARARAAGQVDRRIPCPLSGAAVRDRRGSKRRLSPLADRPSIFHSDRHCTRSDVMAGSVVLSQRALVDQSFSHARQCPMHRHENRNHPPLPSDDAVHTCMHSTPIAFLYARVGVLAGSLAASILN